MPKHRRGWHQKAEKAESMQRNSEKMLEEQTENKLAAGSKEDQK